ncbi:MAG: type III pantothenate kinase [Rhodospirillales bacterium]|jgi:type III pantothenate kinase|nr:pantothenate kinase [Rhodospirillaceae bacterium]MDP6427588.1 type III pantothenate kinase [Rhodospirillales bacterium]MDP6643496.1 type III pantothenate kinase [Rhodospirillales bacterium]MDP6840838.1 type III pantothenate kinase [Rhodospirillales bacterium]|tara:strand:- start:2707 stop:3483 length:777 start_codon:yes stop_codon:yes gene_type:complete
MLLAIDSGNTNVVFAVFNDDGEVAGEWRAATNANRTADEFGVWLCQLMESDGILRGDINSAIIATVVPANLIHLQTLCSKYFECTPLVVGNSDIDLGLDVLTDNPGEVGADRLCNAVAAHASYKGPLLVLDFGTATTFDVVDGDGNYRGGVIYPGINLSLEALHLGAAQLPRVAVDRPSKVIGTSTVSAMQSGIFWGHVAIIEGLAKRIEDDFGAPLTVVATGGLAPLFAEATDAIEYCDHDLTLRGLYLLNKRNRSR